jgi:CelD/BcsL family acetyltransferase involved in cellulose biosynthesis
MSAQRVSRLQPAATLADGPWWRDWDDLAMRTGAPVTASAGWLRSWVDTYGQDRQIVPFSVRDAHGRLDAAAMLAVSRRRPVLMVTAVGHGFSDSARLPAASPSAALALARQVADWITGQHRPWRLRVEQLPVADPVATALHRQLPVSTLRPGDGLPYTLLVPGRTLGTSTHRQHVRRARNRLARGGHRTEVLASTDPAVITAALPDLARVRRARDHALGRFSDLDTPSGYGFWEQVVRTYAGQGRCELTTLRVDGELAAYTLALLEPPLFRLWDQRIDPRWQRFGPGNLLEAEVLERAAADGFERVDRMRGVTRQKMGTADGVEETQQLDAWSSAALETWDRTIRAGRAAGRDLRERRPEVDRAWVRTKQALVRARRAP